MPARRVVLLAAAALLVSLTAGAAATTASKRPAAPRIDGRAAALVALPHLEGRLVAAKGRAPTDASCRATLGSPCYSPQEIRRAYGVDQLVRRGDDGRGETIVIIDSFGSPTIAADLASFDAGYGLPAPPSFRVLAPLGTVAFDPTKIPDQLNWAAETTLDVEWSHAMAPEARIVLLTSPVDETEGTTGMPQFDKLVNYALDHRLGDVISQSWGATENTLFTPAGEQVIGDFERSYRRAAALGVTVLASAGDTGAANYELSGTSFYARPAVGFPASSPFVTAVGGTSLLADSKGDYASETVWDNSTGAGGGGISQVFPEPWYERAFLPKAVQKELGGHRGLPDVSWNADPETPILIYLSFSGSSTAGYYPIGGTSEGAPSWAGLVADLDQFVGRPIGLLNPYLYLLGAAHLGYHDVVVGNNSFAGVTGYEATRGWDPASGWGTPDIGRVLSVLRQLAVGRPSRQALERRALALRS